MKLRNKKTGEIVETGREYLSMPSNSYHTYRSLADLNAEWEDYEEDELLYIVSAEHRSGYQCVLKEDYPEICKIAKELGIGFETEKECKKAVEKLKAWKRLKDNGFRFDGWERHERYCGDFTITASDQTSCNNKDLELLFGGEE